MNYWRSMQAMVDHYLHHPTKMIWVCAALLTFSLIVDGSFLRLWSLHREDKDLSERMKALRRDTSELHMKIQRASDPDQIQLEAQDRLELAGEGDLIFVFSDDNAVDAPNRNRYE